MLDTIFILWAAILGACLGSFYGVCIYRYVHEMPIYGRSFCPYCKKKLAAWHLIPVFSWIFLGGRCAFCRKAISIAHPALECISAMSAFLLATHYGQQPAFAALLLVFGALIVASGIDVACFILPDIITLPLAAASLAIALFVLHMPLTDSLGGGFGGAALLLALRYVFLKLRGVEALGLGDVKLMLALGFLCGLQNLPLLLLAASLSGLALVACRALANRGSTGATLIPFGPFLSLGCFIVLLYGDKINFLFGMSF